MKNIKGEDLNVLDLPAHWLEDYHARIQAGIPSDLNIAADQLTQILGASTMTTAPVTAIVVDTFQAARTLREVLQPGHKVFPVGQGRTGWRCERIIVLATMDQDRFSEWFDTFSCCLEPGGDIIYD
jgi:hypothetical protein